MPNKHYSFTVGKSAVTAHVEADQEGNARFMVRLIIPDRLVRVRIGYAVLRNAIAEHHACAGRRDSFQF